MNMKNLQKGFAIPLIIAIIAILAIGGGVYVYLNKGKTAVFSAVSHSDWKTYKNERAGYSIQYPPNDRITEGSPHDNGIKSPVEFYSAGLSVHALDKNIRYAEDEICSKQKQIVTIDNLQWEKFECKRGFFDSGGSEQVEDYNLEKDGLLYKIQLNFGRGSNKKSRGPMEEMIKTFKFITKKSLSNSSQGIEMSEYENDQFKIAFQYPADWTIGEGGNQVGVSRKTPNGQLRFDLFKFKSANVATRSGLEPTQGCTILEFPDGAKVKCSDLNLPRYVIKYGDNVFLLTFSKNNYQETDPERLKYNQLTAEIFEKNKDSFQKILTSMRFLK